jgi:hypothetical protein
MSVATRLEPTIFCESNARSRTLNKKRAAQVRDFFEQIEML